MSKPKTITVKITEAEIEAIRDMSEDCESMIGGAEALDEDGESWDDIMVKNIEKIQKFFKRNSL